MGKLAATPAAAVAPTSGGAAAAGWSARVFDRVDADGGGRITLAEAEAAGEARFDRTADGDWQLNLQEVAQAARTRIEQRLAKRFESLDANGDGAVARGGFADRAARRVARLEAGGDGTLTRGEMATGFRGGG